MTTPVTETLQALLITQSRENFASFDHWKTRFNELRQQRSPAQTALLGGSSSNGVGYAFAAGYQSALAALTGKPDSNTLSAMCVSESGGNHPRNIQTRLITDQQGLTRLNGAKTFITGGTRADRLLVAATNGTQADGRPALKVVSIRSNAPGVSVTPMAPLPFVPEVEHASVSFDDVVIHEQDILAGDGYADYVKPFRTIEDIHVTLALCGYLFQVCRSLPGSHEQLPCWLNLIASHLQLADLPPMEPTTHALLSGARQQLEKQLPPLESVWQSGDPESFTRWQRDKALLSVAEKARTQRTATALRQLGLP
jgi:hypothetical protein